MADVSEQTTISLDLTVRVSDYFKQLSSGDKEGYSRKLTLTTGERLPDPYAITKHEFSQDLTKWPKVQWPDIYTYLINKPSVYTKESLRAYKSLESYNNVLCGHVQTVLYHPISASSEFCVVCAEVLPSQRQGQKRKLYNAAFEYYRWRLFKRNFFYVSCNFVRNKACYYFHNIFPH